MLRDLISPVLCFKPGLLRQIHVIFLRMHTYTNVLVSIGLGKQNHCVCYTHVHRHAPIFHVCVNNLLTAQINNVAGDLASNSTIPPTLEITKETTWRSKICKTFTFPHLVRQNWYIVRLSLTKYYLLGSRKRKRWCHQGIKGYIGCHKLPRWRRGTDGELERWLRRWDPSHQVGWLHEHLAAILQEEKASQIWTVLGVCRSFGNWWVPTHKQN